MFQNNNISHEHVEQAVAPNRIQNFHGNVNASLYGGKDQELIELGERFIV